MKLLSIAAALVCCWVTAFTLGLFLGIHYTPPPVDCTPYPVTSPLSEGDERGVGL